MGNYHSMRLLWGCSCQLISMSRKNFNWVLSVKSENVNEYCLFNESITFNQVLQIRYFLWHNFFTSPKKFICLEILSFIKNTIHAYYVTNYVT